jgi:DNA topoisomerase-1
MDGSMNIAFGESEGGCGSCSGGQSGGAKRKLSPYNKFVKANFSVMKKMHPSMSAPAIMKMIAQKWKASKPSVSASKRSPAKKTASKKTASKKTASKKTASKK